MNVKKRLMIDMDDVICVNGFLHMINKYLGSNYTIDDFDEFYMQDILDDKDSFFEWFKNQNMYDYCELMPDCYDVMYELNKKYDEFSLNKIRKFYNLIEKMATLSPNLSYSHYVELLPIKDINKINYYIKICEEQNLGVRDLRNKIKSKEYERLDENTKNKLINKEEEKIEDFIKNPILIKNSYNEEINEKLLKRLILEDIDNFLKELGSGFCYIENKYKIKIGERYNYIDLLLFNYIYNAFVVVELKITELKKENIGQIKMYMNYIDKNVKSITQDNTIGIIICKKDNMFIMEYCSDSRVYRTIYECI